MVQRPPRSGNIEFSLDDGHFRELLENIEREPLPDRLLELARQLQLRLQMRKQEETSQ